MADDKLVFNRIHLEQIDSTNSYLRKNAALLCDNADDCFKAVVVTAENQTSGRGQRGNVWLSQSGVNLLMSILVHPLFLPVGQQFRLSQIVALSLCRAMRGYGIDASLKWPNDIYVGNRKLAGILIELDYSGSVVGQAVIGIGLNVNQTEFAAMDRVPVSMKMLRGCDFSVSDVMDSCLCCFSDYYMQLASSCHSVIETEYNSLLLGAGECRRYIDKDGCFDATMIGVEPAGYLLLRRSDGTVSRYAFKEVEQIIL